MKIYDWRGICHRFVALWALGSLGDLEVEPKWRGDSRRSDAVSDTPHHRPHRGDRNRGAK